MSKILDMINEKDYHLKSAEDLDVKILGILKPIFYKLRQEYLDHPKHGTYDWEEKLEKNKRFIFDGYSTLDGYRVDGNNLYLNYYERGYDCYDSAEFIIPLSVVEDELSPLGNGNETVVWYKEQLDNVQRDIDKEKEAKKKKAEDAEYQKYLKLKEKYEK